jgi:hypothetical protein
VPTPRLVEIAYWLIRREILSGVVDEKVATARDRALRHLDGVLATSGDDDDTGLPSWVVQSGIAAADGSTPFN